MSRAAKRKTVNFHKLVIRVYYLNINSRYTHSQLLINFENKYLICGTKVLKNHSSGVSLKLYRVQISVFTVYIRKFHISEVLIITLKYTAKEL